VSLFYVIFSGESEGSGIFDGGMDPLFRTIPEQNMKIPENFLSLQSFLKY
jgi:hypothetical protein